VFLVRRFFSPAPYSPVERSALEAHPFLNLGGHCRLSDVRQFVSFPSALVALFLKAKVPPSVFLVRISPLLPFSRAIFFPRTSSLLPSSGVYLSVAGWRYPAPLPSVLTRYHSHPPVRLSDFGLSFFQAMPFCPVTCQLCFIVPLAGPYIILSPQFSFYLT